MKRSQNIAALPKGALATLDMEDFMQIINKLMQQKESFQSDISMKVVEIDTWIQVLQATTIEDVEELFDSLPHTLEFTADEKRLLFDYYSVSKKMSAYSHLGNCDVCVSEEGNLLVKFTPPASMVNGKQSKFMIRLTTTEDNAYTVKSHDLPDAIPVAKLERKYLENKYGTDAILKKFTTAIYQYTWPLFNRQNQATVCEGMGIPRLSTYVYRNDGLTLMSFTLGVLEDERSTLFEFVLEYDPLDILPSAVSTEVIKGDAPTVFIQDYIKEIALEMKSKPFTEVLRSSLLSVSAIQRDLHRESSDSEASSTSTIAFQMF